MKKKTAALLSILAVTLSRAADVDVKPVPYVRDEKRIQAFDDYLRNVRHFRANSSKELEKNLKDDWILANHFIETAMTPMEKAKLVNMVNRYLADREIKRLQRESGISDEVAKSYYLDHLREYRLKPIVGLKIFHFKTLDAADKFYRFAREHGQEEALAEAEKEGVKAVDYVHPLNMMQPVYRLSLKNLKDRDYFTPPQFVGKGYVVLYVDEITPKEGYVPYEKAKKGIKKTLWKKTYLRKRMEILSSYEEKKQ